MHPDAVPKKLVRAVIYTSNNLRIEGAVFAGENIRLSNELNISNKRFLFVKDASVTVPGTQTAVHHGVLFVTKDQVVGVAPQE